MKRLIFLITFFIGLSFSSNVWGSVDCRQVKDRMVLFCEGLYDQCEYIKNCLHRRDTCVEKEPQGEQECLRMNNCMNKVAGNMPGRERCRYKWVEREDYKRCSVEGGMFFIEEACPGNIDGILSAMAYGLKATVETDYTCKSTTKLYEKKRESCQEYRESFAQNCMNENSAEDKVIYAESEPTTCHEYESFAQIPPGTFYMDIEGVEEFSSNRGYIGNQRLVPTGRGYRGSEQSASQR